MKNKKGLVLSILLGCFIFGVTIPLFMTNQTKVKADTITDLSGSTWVFNNTIDVTNNFTYYIDFISNNENMTFIKVGESSQRPDRKALYYNQTQVYYQGSFATNYQTIVISSGTDVTNSNLITWLSNNATMTAYNPPTPQGTQITHLYWSIATGFRMSENELYSDNDIEYTVLFNEQRRQFDETTQTGLVFKGPTSQDETCYMYSINGDGINLLYRSEDDRFMNACWFEFTPGDYIDTDLYNFMDLIGYWFDDSEAYLCGTNQGYAEGKEIGRALGQADGVEYTGLVTGIFNGLGGLLNIQVFPNITIGLLIGLPLLLGALIIILKILRG